ncbi:serine hydrolase domain-containing protein [Dyella humicola]|uniref:serine hydrolase domain-containing protein n=1 Tax=Dyella humicola TaxID=2992126 RepID=UPI00225414A0|nr:serine hydrolase domain-containing protein [Dyella humicola]
MTRARMICGTLCVTLALSACASAGNKETTDTGRTKALHALLDRQMPKLLADNGVPSVSIAHIEHGKVVFVAAYGSQSPGVPATEATLYNVASLTKPVTAQVMLRLVSEGKVSLDEPMYTYWLDPDIARDERAKLLTPRYSLSHQTGFPNWRRMTGGVLTFKRPPGQAFGYSGEGYEYMKRFAENKLRTPFETLAETQVLQPLGMTDTAYTGRPWFKGRIAVPTNAQGKVLEPEIADKAFASDMLYTTARDYAKFMQAVLDDTGLTPAVAQERIRIQVREKIPKCMPIKTGCPDDEGMGLGWEVIRFGDDTYLMHDGSDEGVATLVYLSLKDRNGTVILTNSDNGKKLVLPIFDLIGSDPTLIACLRNETC